MSNGNGESREAFKTTAFFDVTKGNGGPSGGNL